MRFLWVEDFNEGSSDRKILEDNWKKYFRLDNDKLIHKETLKETLAYLDNEDSINQFDYVLIDIRFPIGDDDKDRLYDDYLKKYITRNIFFQYAEKATGILLYLALVFRYNINKEKIVFISANINDDNDNKDIINKMKHILYAYKFNKKLTNEQISEYEATEYDLVQLLAKLKNETEEEIYNKIPQFIDTKDKTIINDYQNVFDCLIEIDDFLTSNIHNNDDAKYNSVKQQFNDFGLTLPMAYEKPTEKQIKEKDKGWEFISWKETINTDYYKLRSCIIEMCTILINSIEDISINRFNTYMDKDKKVNLDSIKKFLKLYIIPALANLEKYNLQENQHENKLDVIYKKFIRDLTYLWEGAKSVSNINVTNEPDNYFAYYIVMKLLRNWHEHNKIDNYTTKDLAFIFIVCMRSFFDINTLDKVSIDKYNKYEDDLIRLIGDNNVELSWSGKDGIYFKLMYSYNEFYRLSENANKSKHRITSDVYKYISNIGSENSKEKVCMQYIYKLFWHCTFPIDELVFEIDNVNEKYLLEIKQDDKNPNFHTYKDKITNDILKSIYNITWN